MRCSEEGWLRDPCLGEACEAAGSRRAQRSELQERWRLEGDVRGWERKPHTPASSLSTWRSGRYLQPPTSEIPLLPSVSETAAVCFQLLV